MSGIILYSRESSLVKRIKSCCLIRSYTSWSIHIYFRTFVACKEKHFHRIWVKNIIFAIFLKLLAGGIHILFRIKGQLYKWQMSKTNKVSFPTQGLFYWMGRVLVWPRARANFIITSHRSWHHNTQKPREGFGIFSQDTDVTRVWGWGLCWREIYRKI